jgi:hypothetical protein
MVVLSNYSPRFTSFWQASKIRVPTTTSTYIMTFRLIRIFFACYVFPAMFDLPINPRGSHGSRHALSMLIQDRTPLKILRLLGKESFKNGERYNKMYHRTVYLRVFMEVIAAVSIT